MSDSHDRAVREYREADHAFGMAMARVISRDDMLALPKDVRDCRALLECEAEAERRAEALTVFEQARAALEERWIAAHEDMYGVRRLANR